MTTIHRSFIPIAAMCVAVTLTISAQTRRATTTTTTAPRKGFTVIEATIPEMRAAMEQGRLTSRELVRQYLIRVATYEDKLHAAITINPRALDEADARDRDRAARRIMGPLHGIPVALKDNIHTTDMPTTGGALAFEGLVPPYEGTLTKNLRAAGAIVIAKTGLTELANWVRSEEHTSEPSHSQISYAVFCLKKKKKTTSVHIAT